MRGLFFASAALPMVAYAEYAQTRYYQSKYQKRKNIKMKNRLIDIV
jgi:hypothetical protein